MNDIAMSGDPEANVIECRDLSKNFMQGDQRLEVLRGINFILRRQECVAVTGSSGAGKSTFLHLLGGLDKPSGGEVIVAGHRLSGTKDAVRGRLRNRFLGFIYQFHHLLPEFTALENVAMPLLIRGYKTNQARHSAQALLTKVGLGQRLFHKPGELSGGERQRAAVARALITEPACVLADEPTGNLDRHNAEQVFSMMLELNRALGMSLIIVTHDDSLAAKMDSIWRLDDGLLERQS